MKNEKNIKAYLEKLNGMRLSDDSRARMRKELESFADFHTAEAGVRASDAVRSIGQEAPVSASFIHRIFGKRTVTMTATILAIVLVGGGTSFAAEGAVPGDLLYPIKTEVNENVKSAFAVSNESEAQLQAQLAEERLAEAEELAARGELDAAASTEIRDRLAAHLAATDKYSKRAEAAGGIGSSAIVRATLDGVLRGHANMLARIDARAGSNSSAGIASDLAAYAGTRAATEAATEESTAMMMATDGASTESEATAEAEFDIDLSGVEAVAARAETLVAEVEAKLERARSEISAEAHARLSAQLDAAAEAQARAEASLQAKAHQEAYAEAKQAIRTAAEVQSMLESALRLDIEIGGVIDGNAAGGVSGQPPIDDGDTEPSQPPQEDDGYNPFPPRETDDGGLVQPMSGDSDRATDSGSGSSVEIDGNVDVESDTSIDTDTGAADVESDTSAETDGSVRLNL